MGGGEEGRRVKEEAHMRTNSDQNQLPFVPSIAPSSIVFKLFFKFIFLPFIPTSVVLKLFPSQTIPTDIYIYVVTVINLIPATQI